MKRVSTTSIALAPTDVGAVGKAWDEVSASFDRFCLAAGIDALGAMAAPELLPEFPAARDRPAPNKVPGKRSQNYSGSPSLRRFSAMRSRTVSEKTIARLNLAIVRSG
jgi:hypothetical protein